MALLDDDEEQPPPYEGPEDYDSCDMVQPAILVLTGRLISLESAATTTTTTTTTATAGDTSASSSSPPPLWELDHDVSYLSRADHKVEFFRHETRYTSNSNSGHRPPQRRHHKRHLFSLENPHPLLGMPMDYAWYLTSVSRRTLGHVGLRKKKNLGVSMITAGSGGGGGSGFRVLRMNHQNRMHINVLHAGADDADDELLFDVTRVEGRYEWWDHEGKRVAIEDRAADGRCKMVVTTALSRQRADGLSCYVVSSDMA